MARLLEQGDIYLFYEPRREVRQVKGREDVDRVYLILSGDHQYGRPCRMLALEDTTLPVALPEARGQTVRARIEAFSHRPEDMESALASRRVRGATGKERGPVQRPAGEGRYALVEEDGRTMLDYVLELPRVPGPVQRELGIQQEATYGIGLRGVAQTEPISDPSAINSSDVDLELEAHSQDVPQEIEEQMRTERETAGTAEVFGEMKLEKSTYPLEPLLSGQWR